jgi:hypothetical protein
VNNPNCVTAFSVITSLYGFGDDFAKADGAGLNVVSVFLLFGLAGVCCEKQKPVIARQMVIQKNRFIIQYIEK